jgi:hypothetical protein
MNGKNYCCTSKKGLLHGGIEQTNINNIIEPHHGVCDEVLCHLPYAIFSVALAMIFLSLLSCSSGQDVDTILTYRLFHNFHFLHLLFAGTGTMLTFRRYSKKVFLGVFVGFCVPVIFCTFSDAVLPYLGGVFINLDMKFHWCFINHLSTVLPFLLVGMLNGWIVSTHTSTKVLFYSVGVHFLHIFISSMASILYLVSFGFNEWWTRMGFVFLYMIVVVLIPCTLADIVLPALFARFKKLKNNK